MAATTSAAMIGSSSPPLAALPPIDGTHAEAYLHARAIGHCRFTALWFHPDLIHRGDDGIHRLPALVATVTGDNGLIEGVQRTWLPKLPPRGRSLPPAQGASGASTAGPLRFRACLPAKGIEILNPRIHAAATLSAGNGAFEPPQDLALLVIARDKDRHAAVFSSAVRGTGIPSIVIVPPFRF